MDSSSNAVLLETTLQLAVPMWFRRFKMVGGPDDTDLEWAREWAWVIGSQGDQLLFKSQKKGETAALFNDLARAIAIMAYVDGGVTVFGRHWEAER